MKTNPAEREAKKERRKSGELVDDGWTRGGTKGEKTGKIKRDATLSSFTCIYIYNYISSTILPRHLFYPMIGKLPAINAF